MLDRGSAGASPSLAVRAGNVDQRFSVREAPAELNFEPCRAGHLAEASTSQKLVWGHLMNDDGRGSLCDRMPCRRSQVLARSRQKLLPAVYHVELGRLALAIILSRAIALRPGLIASSVHRSSPFDRQWICVVPATSSSAAR